MITSRSFFHSQLLFKSEPHDTRTDEWMNDDDGGVIIFDDVTNFFYLVGFPTTVFVFLLRWSRYALICCVVVVVGLLTLDSVSHLFFFALTELKFK